MEEIKNKISKFINELNKYGVPLPMLKNPDTGTASVSLTMLFISFNIVVVGLIGKWSNLLEGVNLDQALTLFMVTSTLYFGRSLTKSNSKTGETASITQQKEGQ